jgi:hypothetical protein
LPFWPAIGTHAAVVQSAYVLLHIVNFVELAGTEVGADVAASAALNVTSEKTALAMIDQALTIERGSLP